MKGSRKEVGISDSWSGMNLSCHIWQYGSLNL